MEAKTGVNGVKAKLDSLKDFFLELLVIQGTPFCNIDCKYCYLPNRNDNNKITTQTFSKILDRVFENKSIRAGFTIVWHAGEPLVRSIDFYREVFRNIDKKEHTKSQNFTKCSDKCHFN